MIAQLQTSAAKIYWGGGGGGWQIFGREWGRLEVAEPRPAIILNHAEVCNYIEQSIPTNDYFEYSAIRVLFNFTKPFRQTVETWLTSHIVNKNNCMRRSIIALCDRPEPFLTRCIPNLKLNTP